jgi:hypothetical protein
MFAELKRYYSRLVKMAPELSRVRLSVNGKRRKEVRVLVFYGGAQPIELKSS